jgi:uridine phosphorylase
MSGTGGTSRPPNAGSTDRVRTLAAMKMPRYVLLPGDPDRINLMATQWQQAEVVELGRGYRAAVGTYNGVRIGAVCTLMGAPSLEIIFADLAHLGANTFIRVGTCGSIRKEIDTGSIIINDASVRLDGTTQFYVRNEFPAAASYEVTFALADAAAQQRVPYHVGTGATSGSFFVGQGRQGWNGYMSLEGERILDEMRRAGVLNFEMETAALLTLARLFGLRAGSVCAVVANRVTDVWDESVGVERACMVAAEAVKRLSEWDARTQRHGGASLVAAAFSEKPRVSNTKEE